MKYNNALHIAQECTDILGPYCSIFLIAGSLRRKCSEVGDIEFVLERIPREAYNFVQAVNKWQKVRGEPTGRYTQRLYPCPPGIGGSIKLDIFMSLKSDFWRQFAIRTGSEEFSKKLANGWKKKGWVGTKDGLRRVDECVNPRPNVWICGVDKPTLPPVWSDEADFFQWLGMEYVLPEMRQ